MRQCAEFSRLMKNKLCGNTMATTGSSFAGPVRITNSTTEGLQLVGKPQETGRKEGLETVILGSVTMS